MAFYGTGGQNLVRPASERRDLVMLISQSSFTGRHTIEVVNHSPARLVRVTAEARCDRGIQAS